MPRPLYALRDVWSGDTVGAGFVLAVWGGLVLRRARRRGRTFVLQVAVRRRHQMRACAQAAIFIYRGWYWRPVYEAAHLIAAQLVFACAFDMLLAWSRRDAYRLGFGPFPVIFSINLFFWFRPDWFWAQFVMVAACRNRTWAGGEPDRRAPRAEDLPIVPRGSKGPLAEREPHTLFALACERGFVALCADATPSR